MNKGMNIAVVAIVALVIGLYAGSPGGTDRG